MQLSPEIKAQLEEQKKQCIFCKIVKGEIPGKKVYEDDLTLAMLDIYPAVKGHTIFLLKEHYPIMPYLSHGEFTSYFGLVPALVKAVKEALAATAFNIFIANGAAAGQQSTHFLIHLLPREESDGFFHFYLDSIKDTLLTEKKNSIKKSLASFLNTYFSQHPFPWHKGKGSRPDFLPHLEESSIVYEDEKVQGIFPPEPVVPGHITLYSKTEESKIEKLSPEDAVHLFYVASFAASALFEGLKVQGTNIILKSGRTDDNPSGKLRLEILPRVMDDGLQKIVWKPAPPSYDLDKIAEKIQDKTWKIKMKKEHKTEIILPLPPTLKIAQWKPTPSGSKAQEEIRAALEQIYTK